MLHRAKDDPKRRKRYRLSEFDRLHAPHNLLQLEILTRSTRRDVELVAALLLQVRLEFVMRSAEHAPIPRRDLPRPFAIPAPVELPAATVTRRPHPFAADIRLAGHLRPPDNPKDRQRRSRHQDVALESSPHQPGYPPRMILMRVREDHRRHGSRIKAEKTPSCIRIQGRGNSRRPKTGGSIWKKKSRN